MRCAGAPMKKAMSLTEETSGMNGMGGVAHRVCGCPRGDVHGGADARQSGVVASVPPHQSFLQFKPHRG